MVSQPKGKLFVLCWVDSGVVKPVILDTGAMPVTETNPLTAIDVTLAASDITLGVTESSPITAVDALLVDTTITLKVSEQSPVYQVDAILKSSEITLPVSEQSPLSSIQAQGYGYTGSAWQKAAMLWGFTERWSESLDIACSAAGYEVLRTTAVAAGYVHVVEACAVSLFNRQTTSVSIECRSNPINVPLNAAATLAANTWMFWAGRATLEHGDQIQFYLAGTQENDALSARVWGYKMKVDM